MGTAGEAPLMIGINDQQEGLWSSLVPATRIRAVLQQQADIGILPKTTLEFISMCGSILIRDILQKAEQVSKADPTDANSAASTTDGGRTLLNRNNDSNSNSQENPTQLIISVADIQQVVQNDDCVYPILRDIMLGQSEENKPAGSRRIRGTTGKVGRRTVSGKRTNPDEVGDFSFASTHSKKKSRHEHGPKGDQQHIVQEALQMVETQPTTRYNNPHQPIIPDEEDYD